MTSEDAAVIDASTAYVWIWLPRATEPVVCGRLDDDGGRLSFTYARSYRERADAVAIYEPELALRPGAQFAASGDGLPLCIDDAAPDSWGRSVVNHRLDAPTAEFGELTYLLASGSDRAGALDFQPSSSVYEPPEVTHPSLGDLAEAARCIEDGLPIDAALHDALLRGTSIGGARPKALVDDGARKLIAKFSSSADLYPVVQGEFVAMTLAARAGLLVSPVELTRAAGRYALLVGRFDREPDGSRRRVVSALTVLGLNPFPDGRHATYADLADEVRSRFLIARRTLHELFARIAFNILCGNTDDHGRNHAAFVTETGLELTPAYDICPQARTGREANLAMAYDRDRRREARLEPLIAAAEIYQLDRAEATEVVDRLTHAVRENWEEVCDRAELTSVQRQAFMGSQFLNPYAFEA